MDLVKGKIVQPKHYCTGWISAMIWAEAIRKAGKNLNHESMVEALEDLKLPLIKKSSSLLQIG